MLGTISAVLTTTTVNVAIPDIMGAFGIGQDRAQWLSTGMLAAMTVGMLLNAWLMDSFGERRTFIGGALPSSPPRCCWLPAQPQRLRC